MPGKYYPTSVPSFIWRRVTSGSGRNGGCKASVGSFGQALRLCLRDEITRSNKHVGNTVWKEWIELAYPLEKG